MKCPPSARYSIESANKYNVTLNKTDSIGKSLSGAKFSISVVDGSDPLGSLDGVQFEVLYISLFSCLSNLLSLHYTLLYI